MPAVTDHPSFSQPALNATVWRYMDVARYLDIATRGRMFMCRQDRFRDPFEGSITSAMHRAIELQSAEFDLTHEPEISMAAQLSAAFKASRETTFISCWHLNEGESAAMWDLYGRDGYAIAFRTSYIKLREALPSYSYLGKVKYIDFESECFAVDNLLNPSMHKRRSFEHEHEVRAVISTFAQTTNEFNAQHEVTEFGLTVPLDINFSIDGVHLSPDAADWFVRLIKEVNAKLGIMVPVTKSSMYGKAIF